MGFYNAFLMARQYYQMNEKAPSTQTNYLNMIFTSLPDVTQYLGPDVYELPVIAGDSIKITVSNM